MKIEEKKMDFIKKYEELRRNNAQGSKLKRLE
jgi:hypothetical protein